MFAQIVAEKALLSDTDEGSTTVDQEESPRVSLLSSDSYRLLNEEWTKGVSEWPPVEYRNLFSHFISTPGMYISESLDSYKSIDSCSMDVS